MISRPSLASTRIRSYSDDHTTLANVAEGETLVDQLRRSFDPDGTGQAVNGKVGSYVYMTRMQATLWCRVPWGYSHASVLPVACAGRVQRGSNLVAAECGRRGDSFVER